MDTAHPPTHPELLEVLARKFVQHGYDLRSLIRLIIESRTYQLSGIPNDTNQHDEVNYSRALPWSLEAEVLLDAINQVSGVRDENGQFYRVYGKPDRATIPERSSEPNLAQATSSGNIAAAGYIPGQQSYLKQRKVIWSKSRIARDLELQGFRRVYGIAS